MERLTALDCVLDLKLHGVEAWSSDLRTSPDVSKWISFDWNVTIRQ